MQPNKKWYNILVVLPLFILIVVVVLMMSGTSEKEIVQNYEKHKTGFIVAEDFFRKMTSNNFLVKLIKFNSRASIDIIIWEKKQNAYENIINERNVPVDDPRIATCLTRISWTKQDLSKLYELLRRINCDSIGYASSHIGFENVIEIGYKMRLLSLPHVYLIFQDTICKEEIEGKCYSDAKIHYLDERVAWTYLTF